MPKASPLLHAFNAGEFSPWMEGRTDIDKYPASLRRSVNFLPAPQGPAMRRPGTALSSPIFDETKQAYFVPFIFSNDVGQTFQIEFGDQIAQLHSEAGLLAQFPVAVTLAFGNPLVVRAPGHGAVVGNHGVLAGFGYSTNLNGTVAKITAVAGDDLTTDIPFTGVVGSLTTATFARVFTFTTPYTAADVSKLRYVGDRDTLYLFCEGYAPYKLVRYSAYDWRLTKVEFIDGPYDNVNDGTTNLRSDVTGTAVPIMTADNLPTGVCSSSGAAAGTAAWKAFDQDSATYWQSSAQQTGWLQYQFAAAQTVDGYSIEILANSTDASYTAVDSAPSTWAFEGSNDGVTYVSLDSQINYVLYDNQRSAYFKVQNSVAYIYYRLNIRAVTRNGPLSPTIARLVMTTRASAGLVIIASSTTGINNDRGFLATDVDRAIRLRGQDGVWRPVIITTVNSTVNVNARLQGDALDVPANTTQWRLGLFSATTGWPTCGGWYEDRLVMAGMFAYADWLVLSATGKYETITQTNPAGDVADNNGIVVRVNARRLGRIVWVASDNRSLLLGTGSGEWSVASADLQAALSARTAKARRSTVRGSANVEPITVDNKTLFVQRSGRSIREMSYEFTSDGYKTPSLSLFASHLGALQYVQIDFAYEPLSIAWLRTATGQLIGLTYNREENVVGHHVHDLAGGFVECISVMPGADGRQDLLWMIVRRQIGNQTRRFVEYMTNVFDFGDTLDTAFFVDCGIRYTGAPISTLYGLKHLEGMTVVGLADGSPFVPQVVLNGSITLANGIEGSNIVVGLPYDSMFETSRLEAGAGDGTAQGKTKRITGVVLRLWQSGGGEYGTRDTDDEIDDDNLDGLEYLTPDVQFDTALALFNGDTRFLKMPDVYNKAGTVVVRQRGVVPLPLNVTAIMPQVNTQDR